MTDRKKTLISILSSFLIVILIITNNKSLTMKKEKHGNDNKTVKKEKIWKKPEGNMSSIKIYLDYDLNKIITSKEEINDNYKYLNEYKCLDSSCTALDYNINNNHIIIKDNDYVIYDYKTNLYKKIVNIDNDCLDVKLLYFENKDYGLALKDQTNNYAFYSFEENKVTTEYTYNDILTNEASYLNNCFIATTILDNKTTYNIVNYNNNTIIGESDSKIKSIGNKNVYYYLEENERFKFYKDNFQEINGNDTYTLYGITSMGNLVVSKDNISFAIYNKNGKLIKESKPYKQIYAIIDKYIIVNDNDDELKIIDFDSNIIKKILPLNDSIDFVSGEYKNNIIYIDIFNKLESKHIKYSYSLKDKTLKKQEY